MDNQVSINSLITSATQLKEVFTSAVRAKKSYVAVALVLPNVANYEVIINDHCSIESKLEYYLSTYDDDLVHYFNKDIKIVGATSGDSYSDVYNKLFGSVTEMVEVEPSHLNCSVCGDPASEIAPTMLGAFTLPYCTRCVQGGAEPYSGLVDYVYSRGIPNYESISATSVLREVVDFTLGVVNKSVDTFDKDLDSM